MVANKFKSENVSDFLSNTTRVRKSIIEIPLLESSDRRDSLCHCVHRAFPEVRNSLFRMYERVSNSQRFISLCQRLGIRRKVAKKDE